MSAFIIERNVPGFSVSKKFDKLGQRASDTAEIALDEVVVPESQRLGREGDGFMIAMVDFNSLSQDLIKLYFFAIGPAYGEKLYPVCPKG
jgi:acyl-CoA dehydrogenase